MAVARFFRFRFPGYRSGAHRPRLSAHALVVIDGYHAFAALPVDLSAIAERAFYLAGGYKYAMAGEGACFLAVPPGTTLRPLSTGWFADFEGLSGAQHGAGRIR